MAGRLRRIGRGLCVPIDPVRGAIMAAKEDVLDGRGARRYEQLEAVAAAV